MQIEGCKTGAVIVAAGMSSRMGEFKPLLPLGGISFVRRTITNFKQAGAGPIVVVCGYRARDLERHVACDGVLCVRNEDYAHTQMMDSARIGLSYVIGKCARTLFSPVDVPLVRSSTIQALIKTDGKIIRPVYKGMCGHPILMNAAFVASVLASSTDNLASFLRDYTDETQFVSVSDEGILLDADTPQDYNELIRLHDKQLFRPQVQVSLWRHARILDERTALLLRAIDYDGTVKEACQRLAISYRKAWNMLSEIENNVGAPVVARSVGGEHGGTSALTPLGVRLLERYEQFADDIQKYAQVRFDEAFGDIALLDTAQAPVFQSDDTDSKQKYGENSGKE